MLDGILNDQSSQHKSEDGSDVSQGAVDLCLRGAPFVIQQVRVARARLRFGTHTLLSTTGGVMAFVFQQLIRKDALKLALRILSVALETLAESTGQRVALNLPELSGFDARGVELQCCTHR